MPPSFSVWASATAATGYIRRTEDEALKRVLPRLASVQTGSKQSTRSGPVNFENLLSIGDAYAVAEEHESYEEGKQLATTNIRLLDVVVAGRLRVKRLEAGIVSSRKGSQLIEFKPRELELSHVTLDSRRILVEFDTLLFRASATKAALMRAYARNIVPSTQTGLNSRVRKAKSKPKLSETGGYFVSSIVRRIYLSDPDSIVDGHIIALKGFGRIYFGEIIISPLSRSLTLMRIELGSPVEGRLSLASTESIAIPIAPEPKTKKLAPEKAIVRIFFATDRRVATQGTGHVTFENARSLSSELTLGTCEVSIPRDHRLARLEAPSIWRLEFRPDPRKHVLVRKTAPLLPERFYEELSARTAASRQAFVFVHGYNVAFNDAARRTAQLAYDLQFAGAAVLYSWPSIGRVHGYFADEATIEWSIPHLAAFLSDLARLGGAETIHLIGHSMGNRALTRALEQLVPLITATGALFREVVLTAPDIDAGVFRQIALNVAGVSQRITMYASQRDKALLTSQRFHAFARAGSEIVVVPGVDTVDASAVDTSLIGHSFFGDNRSVLSDMYSVIRSAPAEGRFGLTRISGPNGVYFAFNP